MEYICEDNQVGFNDFEKKVGTQGSQAGEAPAASGSAQSIVGDWKGTLATADARSFPATASFSAASTGVLAVADPSANISYQFQKVVVSEGGNITAITAEGINLLGKLAKDGKEITGDIILPNGTGHKIIMSRP
jgi:hypothetical protein